jgi:hypothetical protein
MPTVQVYNVSFDTTDEGFDALTPSQVKMLEGDIEGRIFEIDADSNDTEEFEYEICEEITSETGWLVNTFDYRLITIGE